MNGRDPDPHKRMPAHLGLLQLCARASSNGTEESPSQETNSVPQQSSETPSQDQDPTSAELREQQPTETEEERQAFFFRALAHMVRQTDPVEIMRDHICSIKADLQCIAESSENITEDLCSSLLRVLSSLMYYTDSLDNAIDFHKIGGFDIIHPLLKIPHDDVKAKTLELIAVLVQNNTYCQKQVIEAGLLPKLFNILEEDTNETVCTKALYAISCLCRHNNLILPHLIEVDGVAKFLCALQKPSIRMRTKAAFLLANLCQQLPEIRDELFNHQAVQKISFLLQDEYGPSHEYLLSALLELVSQHQPSQRECLNPELKLKGILLALMQHVQNCPEHEEASTHLSALLKYSVSDSEVPK